MSGAFGWHGGSRSSYTPPSRNSDNYGSARQAYTPPPAPQVTRVNPPKADPYPKADPSPAAHEGWKASPTPDLTRPTAKHALSSTAENVVIVVADLTGSMDTWPAEIFKRLPLMYAEVQDYLGDDLEFLFIAHHDAHADTDLKATSCTQVTRFGRGPELDGLLASFHAPGRTGGGQGYESHELVAYYLLHQVDTSSAKNVYAYFITDEMPYTEVKRGLVQSELGLTGGGEATVEVFRALQQKMDVFTLLRRATNYPLKVKAFHKWWTDTLGQEHVLPLDDHRRAVDVMLGAMAAHTGQKEKFTRALQSRQGTMKFGAANIQTVLHSIAFVGPSGPSEPDTVGSTTKGLLD